MSKLNDRILDDLRDELLKDNNVYLADVHSSGMHEMDAAFDGVEFISQMKPLGQGDFDGTSRIAVNVRENGVGWLKSNCQLIASDNLHIMGLEINMCGIDKDDVRKIEHTITRVIETIFDNSTVV